MFSELFFLFWLRSLSFQKRGIFLFPPVWPTGGFFSCTWDIERTLFPVLFLSFSPFYVFFSHNR